MNATAPPPPVGLRVMGLGKPLKLKAYETLKGQNGGGGKFAHTKLFVNCPLYLKWKSACGW